MNSSADTTIEPLIPDRCLTVFTVMCEFAACLRLTWDSHTLRYIFHDIIPLHQSQVRLIHYLSTGRGRHLLTNVLQKLWKELELTRHSKKRNAVRRSVSANESSRGVNSRLFDHCTFSLPHWRVRCVTSEGNFAQRRWRLESQRLFEKALDDWHAHNRWQERSRVLAPIHVSLSFTVIGEWSDRTCEISPCTCKHVKRALDKIYVV